MMVYPAAIPGAATLSGLIALGLCSLRDESAGIYFEETGVLRRALTAGSPCCNGRDRGRVSGSVLVAGPGSSWYWRRVRSSATCRAERFRERCVCLQEVAVTPA